MSPPAWRFALLLFLCKVAAGLQGPILAFQFDNTTISDDGTTTLSYIGSSISFVPGMVGMAVSFSLASTSYLMSPSLAILPSGNTARTVALWLLPATSPTGSNKFYFAAWGTTTADCLFSALNWDMAAGGKLTFEGRQIAGNAPAGLLYASVWQHVAFTYDSSVVSLFINGVVVRSSSVPDCCSKPLYSSCINTTPNTPLMVGGIGQAGQYLFGAIDQLLIYNRSLSSTEVAALAVTPSKTPTASPTLTRLPSISTSGTPTNTPSTSGTGSVTGTSSVTYSPTDSWQPLTRTPSSVATPSASPTGTVAPSPTKTFLPNIITTIAGFGNTGQGGVSGPATSAALNGPYNVAVDSGGNVYIADSSNHRVLLVNSVTGVISTVAGNGVAVFAGDNGPAIWASLKNPQGMVVDMSGNLYISDYNNARIRLIIKSTGIINSYAGGGSGGDGGQATAAYLIAPSDVALDSIGNLYIVDHDGYKVRFVNKSSGVITTFAGTGSSGFSGDGGQAKSAKMYCTAVALDAVGNVYIADYFNMRVRVVSKASGIISTFAGTGSLNPTLGGDGGAATSAYLYYPQGLAVDALGNVFISDTNNHRIRLVTKSSGIISTFAGIGSATSGFGYGGDGGPPASATLNNPQGIALDPAGNLYIADTNNNRIRMVSAALISPSSSFTTTPTSSPTTYCASSLYRSLPRTDLVGTLTGNAWYPGTALPSSSEASCRQSCCDASNCNAYTFASSDLQMQVQWAGSPTAACFLYTNVTALVPSSGYSSGALLSAYS